MGVSRWACWRESLGLEDYWSGFKEYGSALDARMRLSGSRSSPRPLQVLDGSFCVGVGGLGLEGPGQGPGVMIWG